MIRKMLRFDKYSPRFGLSRVHSVWLLCFSVASFTCLTGCVTTRFRATPPCANPLQAGSKVLLVSLPGEEEFLIKKIKATLEKANVSLEYLPSQEWNLRSAGIVDVLDTAVYSNLKSLGYTHLLLVRELSNRSGTALAFYTRQEVNQEDVVYNTANKPDWNEQGNQSEIMIRLLPIGDLTGAHNVIAKTTIGHLIIRGKRAGETHVNPTTAITARNKAVQRGIKKLLKDCSRKMETIAR